MHEVKVQFKRSIQVAAPPEEVFSVLSDIPDSVAHFPALEKLAPEGDAWRWILEAHGPARYAVKMEYLVRYHSDPDALSVRWLPVGETGNARVQGTWTILGAGTGSRVTLQNDLVIFLDIPRIVRRLAGPVVTKRNRSLLDEYLTNLETTFNGGDGRLRR